MTPNCVDEPRHHGASAGGRGARRKASSARGCRQPTVDGRDPGRHFVLDPRARQVHDRGVRRHGRELGGRTRRLSGGTACGCSRSRLSPSSIGRCLEIGSGTGVLTPYLQERWGDIVCVDLSMEMMSRRRMGSQVQADASRLPFPEGSFDVIVIGDGPLFATEMVRVLSPEATLIWSNALGQGAPYYVPTVHLLDVLVRAARAQSGQQ